MRDSFLQGYVECALWSSSDGDRPLDDSYNMHDIHPITLSNMRNDCLSFQETAFDLLEGSEMSLESQGHNFWLTRNRHGAGFWDRGLGETGKKLTEIAIAFGESSLYVDDEGLIHAE